MIFVYEKEAKIPSVHIKALREAGIVPVQVESLDKCKFIDPEMQPFIADKALIAALGAMAKDIDSFNTVSRMFVNNLYAAVKAPKEQV